MKPINTTRLTLRHFEIADITDAYIAALNDPQVIGLTESRHTRWDRANTECFVRESQKAGEVELVGIFNRSTGAHLGNMRLQHTARHKRTELGIMIWDKREWSKGYGLEALSAVLEYCFNVLNLHRVCADYYSVNLASAKMFERAGFQQEGIFHDHFLLNEQWVDSIRVAIINPNAQRI